ncbi:DUF4286 family protein [Mucilaginibacter sp. UR6-1]|uniref:DUF4286 family protein n=1 Tax=Mucilaginibacter sp. UR6-1 TaxID=1435643 RepID=UPI001E53B3D7|nr:DUF4286 family protein [Mucilaginibacter sp. UR6-1]MCC8410842.1 DUF4286 family protein [Mucilaginibacter sp. UR6-1]
MIIYNETVIVEEASHTEWLTWMQQTQLPAIMAAGHFKQHNILHVMDSPNEGVTYCVQYHADKLEDVEAYFTNHLDGFQAEQQQRFENKLVTFSSLMQTVPAIF